MRSEEKELKHILQQHRSELTNAKYCKACGGKCCQRGGCQYLPFDLDMNKDALRVSLKGGNLSIRATIAEIFDHSTCATVTLPSLHLKVRDQNKDVIDLVSLANTCSVWDPEKGCPYPYQSRPSLAKALIPKKECASSEECHNIFVGKEKLLYNVWLPYQERLVQLSEEWLDESFETAYWKQVLSCAEIVYQKVNDPLVKMTAELEDFANLFYKMGVFHELHPELEQDRLFTKNYRLPQPLLK